MWWMTPPLPSLLSRDRSSATRPCMGSEKVWGPTVLVRNDWTAPTSDEAASRGEAAAMIALTTAIPSTGREWLPAPATHP